MINNIITENIKNINDISVSDSYNQFNNIFTLSETAKYLKLSERTILRMVKKNEIPVTKVGGQWRFIKGIIDEWLITNMQRSKAGNLTALVENGEIKLNLSRLIPSFNVIMDIKPGNKKYIIEQLVKPLAASRYIENEESYIDKLYKREQMVSTALVNSVAIPHIRNLKDNPDKEPCIVLGICREGTDFESMDGKKTKLFFLVSAPSDVVHLRILSKISQLCGDLNIINSIISSNTSDEVLSLLIKYEKNFLK